MIIKVCGGALFFLIGVAACLLPAKDGQAQSCRLTLKNGNVISAPYCYEENGVVYISKLGGTVGMHKRDVAKIEKIEAEETVTASVGAPDAPSAEREGKVRGGTAADRRERKKAEKAEARATKAARAEEERPFKEFKSHEEALRLARISEKIACGQASEPVKPSSRPISGEEAAGRIKARHDASEGCQYYKNRIPKMEKKLEELRSVCGSKCR